MEAYSILALIVSITVLLLLIIKVRVHAFLALLIAAITYGLIAGEGAGTFTNIAEGLGGLITEIGLVIVLGTMIGDVLGRSGALQSMAKWLIDRLGKGKVFIALSVIGCLVSIPVFCDAAFAILAPLVIALSSLTGINVVTMGAILAFSLHSTHLLVPPTPGPLAGAGIIGADLGIVIGIGMLFVIPHLVSGVLWARYIGRKFEHIKPAEDILKKLTKEEYIYSTRKVMLGFLSIILPVVLIALRSIVTLTVSSAVGAGIEVIKAIGDPIAALSIGLVIALLTLDKITPDVYSFNGILGDSVKLGGMMVLIVGAGGAFANVIKKSALPEIIKSSVAGIGVPSPVIALLLLFIIGVLIRSAVGSGTAAIITSTSIIAPILPALGIVDPLHKALAVMAAASGATMVFHANDDYFWVIVSTTGIPPEAALKVYPAGSIIQGVTTFILVLMITLVTL